MITRNQIYKRTVQFRALMQELLELDSLRNKVRNAEMRQTTRRKFARRGGRKNENSILRPWSLPSVVQPAKPRS